MLKLEGFLRASALEITGNLGDLVVDGQQRMVETRYDGHHGVFTLFTTPAGIGTLFPKGTVASLELCGSVRRPERWRTTPA